MSSGGYFVGHPATYTAPAPGTEQAPPQATAGGDQQTPATTTQTPEPTTHNYNYFVGHPVKPERTPPHPAAPPPPPHKNGSSSFLARCFPCICGSRASSEQ